MSEEKEIEVINPISKEEVEALIAEAIADLAKQVPSIIRQDQRRKGGL